MQFVIRHQFQGTGVITTFSKNKAKQKTNKTKQKTYKTKNQE